MAILTNREIVAFFKQCLIEKWGYVWGRQGELYTQEVAESLKARKANPPSGRNPATYWTIDCKKWIDRRVADCSGGFVAAFRSKNPAYSDRSSSAFKSQFTHCEGIKSIDNAPPGAALWRKGHIGLYIGGGKGIEFRGTSYGCVETNAKERGFTHWGLLKVIDYLEVPKKSYPRQMTVHVTNSPLRIREKADVQSRILADMPNGSQFWAQKEDDKGWAYGIWWNGKKYVEGYTSLNYLNPSKI